MQRRLAHPLQNCALALITACIAFAARAELPVAAFANLPEVTEMQLSPSGKHVAYLLTYEGTTLLATRDLNAGTTHGISRTDNEKYTIRWLQWVNDDRLIFSVYYPDRRYGVASGETRLLSAPRTGGKLKLLFRPKQYDSRATKVAQFQDRVVSFLPDDPDHILIALADEKVAMPGVYRVNVKSGQRKRVQRHKSPVRNWIADRQGRVRAGWGYDAKDAIFSVWVKPMDSDSWQVIVEHEAFSPDETVPLGFALDPRFLYVAANHEGRKAVFRLDTSKPDMPRELVFASPLYDIDGALVYSGKTNDVIGVRHSRAPGGVLFLDEQYQQFNAWLARHLPHRRISILGFSEDESRYLVLSSSDTSPPEYYFGNHDRARITSIAQQYPLLADAQLSEVNAVHYKARDGLDIEAYLSLPINTEPRDLPAIIFPHGGPFARAGGGFDYWTQFFTSRGFAVLRPNFRGSTGYGYDFEQAAVSGYGLAMQDDLEDGARWLVQKNIADEQRICIVGASYGGYAALMGAVKTPDFYRCAISYAGMSSLVDYVREKRHFVDRKIARQQVGTERDKLRATSPRYHAKSIEIPVLLAHGDRDRVVLPSHSEEMAAALKAEGKEHVYLELENGSHYLHRQQNRTALFTAMDAFLAEHLAAAD